MPPSFMPRLVLMALALAAAGCTCGVPPAGTIPTLTLTPSTATVPVKGKQAFSVTVTGAASPAVLWSVEEGESGGSIDAEGVYTAPAAAGTFHLKVTSIEAPEAFATATLTVTGVAGPVVTLSPVSATVSAGKTQQFVAAVAGVADGSVLWTVQEGAQGGVISSAGLYTAPKSPGSYHVVARAQADLTASATATVTVIAAEKISVSVTPAAISLTAGGTQQFAATVTGSSNPAVSWSVQEPGGGAITAGGFYTAPLGSPGTYHVVATAKADDQTSASATITVSAANIQVSVNPASLTLGAGQSHQFVATVTGTAHTGVSWSVQESAGGGISSGGYYTAPSIPGDYHVVATSQENPARSAVATVHVVPISVTVLPDTALVEIGDTRQLTATVSGAANTQVTWTVQEGTSCGSVSSAGLYSPPSSPGICHVVATSVANAAQSATATLTVINPVTVSIAPSNATLTMNQTQQFTATVVGSANQNVTWSVKEGAVGGTISATGLYTAPTVAASTPFHVVATPQANPAKAQEATATVNPGIGVQLTPSSITLTPGATQTFSASVTGTANNAVSWSVQEGSSGGTITVGGLYTAPGTSGTYHVVASAAADSSKKGFATVVVLGNPLSVSGTVKYTGSKSGVVYVILASSDGSAGIAGTSTALVSGNAPFTLNGVQQRGSFRVRAFIDTLGTGMYHQAVDPFGSVAVTLGNSNLTNVTVTVSDSSWNGWISTATPSIVQVVPSEESALVAYDPAWDSDGNDECKDYRIYWSDTAGVNGSNNIGSLLVTANAPRIAIVRGLSNGQQLYFTMTCPDALLLGGYAPEVGPVTIGVPAGGFTVNGAVSGALLTSSPTPPLYVLGLSEDAGFLTRVSSPLPSQSWSASGVTAGTYHLYAFLDIGADGKLTPTEPGNFFEPLLVTVSANQTAPTLVLSGANAVATVTTGHLNDQGSHSYGLFFQVRPNLKRPVKVQLNNGPKLSLPLDLPLDETGGARHEVQVSLATTAPATGDSYTLAVTYSDGTSENLVASVSELLPAPVTTAPGSVGSTSPTFQWLPLSPAPATPYYGYLRLYSWTYAALGTGASLLGWADELPGTTTQVLYPDLHPTSPQLSTAILPYWWTLTVVDARGNWARTISSFNAQ